MPSYMPVTSRPRDNSSGLTVGYDRDYLNPVLPKQPSRVGINSQGIYINLATGQPHTGEIPSAVVGGAALGFANNGRLVANPLPATGATGTTAADAFAPTLTNVVKQPGVISANNDLLTKQNALSNTLNKSFTDYLNEAKEQNAASKIQLGVDQKNIDTSAIERNLPAADSRNESAQRDISTSIGQTNADYAKATSERLARLTEENRRYETAAQAVAGQAFNEAKKQTAIYHLSTGTPTSGSGDLSNRYINAYARINVPLQQQLSDRRYNQINNIEGAATRELYGNDLAFAASKSALESDLSNRSISTLKYLQGLRTQVAGMSRSMAADYLRQLGVPFELGQRIISGDIANLSGIQGIDERANFYGLTQPYDASREAAVITPGIRSPSRNYSPQEPRVTGRPGTVSGGQTIDPNDPYGMLKYQQPVRRTTRQYVDQTPVYSPRETISQEDMGVFDYTPPPDNDWYDRYYD